MKTRLLIAAWLVVTFALGLWLSPTVPPAAVQFDLTRVAVPAVAP
jgi:hypothetical protein